MKLLKKRYGVYKQNCIEANARLRAIRSPNRIKILSFEEWSKNQ